MIEGLSKAWHHDPGDLVAVGAAVIAALSLFISLLTYIRTIKIQRLQLFLEFRARFISDQLSRDMADTAQLLLDSELRLAPEPYQPAVARVLNHLEWVGYFLKKRFVDKEHVWSTFGSDVLSLYPGLFCYMNRQRTERRFPDLWCHVDLLYKRIWRYANWRCLLENRELRSTRKMRDFLPRKQRNRDDIRHYLELLVENRPGDSSSQS